MQEYYTWQALYSDDSRLDEHDAVQGFASVDQERVAILSLLSNGVPVHSVTISGGAQAVFFRRKSLVLNLMDESAKQGQTIHCIGWKRGEEAAYLFVFANGTTLLTSDLQAV